MANDEPEQLSIKALLRKADVIIEWIRDTIGGFVSHPVVVLCASIAVGWWSVMNAYGPWAIVAFGTIPWVILPSIGWFISYSRDGDGAYEWCTVLIGGVIIGLIMLGCFCETADSDPFDPSTLYKTTSLERIKPTSITRSNDMIVLVKDTLVVRSNKIEDFSATNPVICVKHYINDFKIEYTMPPKVCGE